MRVSPGTVRVYLDNSPHKISTKLTIWKRQELSTEMNSNYATPKFEKSHWITKTRMQTFVSERSDQLSSSIRLTRLCVGHYTIFTHWSVRCSHRFFIRDSRLKEEISNTQHWRIEVFELVKLVKQTRSKLDVCKLAIAPRYYNCIHRCQELLVIVGTIRKMKYCRSMTYKVNINLNYITYVLRMCKPSASRLGLSKNKTLSLLNMSSRIETENANENYKQERKYQLISKMASLNFSRLVGFQA